MLILHNCLEDLCSKYHWFDVWQYVAWIEENLYKIMLKKKIKLVSNYLLRVLLLWWLNEVATLWKEYFLREILSWYDSFFERFSCSIKVKLVVTEVPLTNVQPISINLMFQAIIYDPHFLLKLLFGAGSLKILHPLLFLEEEQPQIEQFAPGIF